MKIKPEHFEHMKLVIETKLAKFPDIVMEYEIGNFINSEKTNDLQKRFCFDVLYACKLTPWIVKELYPYMNDEHIYTALKVICPVVKRKY